VIEMGEGYFNTDSYYCGKCKLSHHFGSSKGKAHIKYASAGMKRKMLLEMGGY